MKIDGLPKREPDPVEQEVAEQSARSKEVLERVEKVLKTASKVIEDYRLAEQERTDRRGT